MGIDEYLVVGAYFFVLLILSIFGLHRYYLSYLYKKFKNFKHEKIKLFPPYPFVTIQLPLYNEKYVVERLLNAVSRINYPKDRFEIQVLDDSTDETIEIAKRKVNELATMNFNIEYIHRDNRIGFKAGALELGLKKAKGEFIAVFDADFLPDRDFLIDTLPYFANKNIGMVQTRWGHLNYDFSLLTRTQAILLDGHFVIEHTARNRSGRFFNFNGTAGLWRKECILDAGGWQHDTLTEDLDLSYRAQMKNWKFVFLPDVVSPSEIPVDMNSYKSQQHRWAKGSIQTALKLTIPIVSSDLPLKVKLEALIHLWANISFPLMLILSILMPVSMEVRYNRGWVTGLVIDFPLFLFATFSVCFFYYYSQRIAYQDWKRRALFIPFILSFGIGLTLNNTKAVLEALLGYKTPFERTPKYNIKRQGDYWKKKKYSSIKSLFPIAEIAMGLYFTMAIYVAIINNIWASIPFLLIFQTGFLYVGFLSIFHNIDFKLKIPVLHQLKK